MVNLEKLPNISNDRSYSRAILVLIPNTRKSCKYVNLSQVLFLKSIMRLQYL